MSATIYSGNKLLDLLFRGVAFTAPTRVFVSLHIADPGMTGASEVSSANWPAYARMDPAAGAPAAAGFTAAADKTISNAKEMLFPAVDGASVITATHYGVWDALTGGNCLHVGTLKVTKVLEPTDECVIHVGELDILVN